ncbi:MAG: 5'/3'-nucleotidase SurE [Duncaniella sp.]|nr:5'/3'-nucleotidase SurE [Duncaniella sp.]
MQNEKNIISQRPLILVANDDGVEARGIRHLATLASRYGDVIIAAPLSPQSGMSSALTVGEPLYINKYPDLSENVKVYSVSGTPVDCVKLAMHAIVPSRPDLILSGINHGSNAAVNNIYSGTMGAAMEGCLIGIPSVGFSLLSHDPEARLDQCDPIICHIIDSVLTKGLPEGLCLNVNFPKEVIPAGVKVVRAAKGYWTEEYADFVTPYGRTSYWLTGRFHNEEPDCPETDEYWLARGYASVVPIRPDQTATDSIDTIKEVLGS